MSAPEPKVWFTAADLAALELPGLPTTKRKVNELAAEKRWGLKCDTAGAPLTRPRAARGGGVEYHYSLLPAPAVTQLVRRGLLQPQLQVVAETVLSTPRDHLWAWYDRQTDAVKAEARRRAAALDEVAVLEASGLTRTVAISSVAGRVGVSTGTIWSWDSLARGARDDDRLPKLAPRRKGGGRESEIDPRAWSFFKSDYLRPERPTIAACYDRLKLAAAANGWTNLPHQKTFQRRIEREVPIQVVTLQREGQDALRRTLPPQKRTVAELHAMELVNIDGHRWDVFVAWPDGTVSRPMMVAIQDVYSRKMLAWRIGQTESAVLTRLAFADLFRVWGVPKGCLLDNGRAFASKWITGGAKTRFRFKIREEDPTGLLPALGVNPHWATPYRGQSKPIERYFQLVCEHGAKHPAFAGAYTGNKPDAKPENYGASAVPLDVFVRIAGQVLAANNAKIGRRTEMARGRSYDLAFEESYARSPIGKATTEQLRLALLAADHVSTDRRSGAITLFGNSYWTSELQAIAGQRVVVRFDPDDLQTDVHVYAADGRYLATAPVWAPTGFLDVAAARDRAKLEGEFRKTTRRARDLEQLISAQDLAALLPDEPTEAEVASPTVVRPVRVRTAGAAVARKPAEDVSIDFMSQFTAAEGRLRLVE